MHIYIYYHSYDNAAAVVVAAATRLSLAVERGDKLEPLTPLINFVFAQYYPTTPVPRTTPVCCVPRVFVPFASHAVLSKLFLSAVLGFVRESLTSPRASQQRHDLSYCWDKYGTGTTFGTHKKRFSQQQQLHTISLWVLFAPKNAEVCTQAY